MAKTASRPKKKAKKAAKPKRASKKPASKKIIKKHEAKEAHVPTHMAHHGIGSTPIQPIVRPISAGPSEDMHHIEPEPAKLEIEEKPAPLLEDHHTNRLMKELVVIGFIVVAAILIWMFAKLIKG